MVGVGFVEGGGCSCLTHSRFPEVNTDSTDEPIDPDPILMVSGASAIALLLAGSAGLVVVMVGIGSAIVQTQRYCLSLTRVHGLTSPLSNKTKQNKTPHPKELEAHSKRMALTSDVAFCLLSSRSDHKSQKRVLMLVCLVQVPLLTCKSHPLFVPQFAYLQNGDDNTNTCLPGLL